MTTTTAVKKNKVKKSTAKSSLKYSKEQYLKWYEDMLVMRKVEEKVGHLYIQQKFGGFCHLYIGQEAVVAGKKKQVCFTSTFMCYCMVLW